jgi:hypothetical protein
VLMLNEAGKGQCDTSKSRNDRSLRCATYQG